jgi:hypothetical protein
VTIAELRNLLADCARVWGVDARITEQDAVLRLTVAEGVFEVRLAPKELRPVRWFLQTPERRNAARPPRAAPSVVAMLSALRNAMGVKGGSALRVGGS